MGGVRALAPDIAERTRRRVTRRLMPFLVLVYLTAYIDRANVGIAKLQMQSELHLTDAVIGFGAGIFFAGYFLLELPGTLIVERWSARKWLARIMISWGVVATITGFAGMLPIQGVNLTHQFYWLRFLLGAAEAGFFPGVVVYLAHWYRAEDRARAKAWFMIAQPLSVVIGLPVSRWILENVHWLGLSGWRWVFILEGVPPVLLGFVTLFYLTDRVHGAKWLPADEREWLAAQLAAEDRERTAQGRVNIAAAFRNPQTLLLAFSFFLIVTGNQAILFFLPSITDAMKSMSITARTAVTVLPYVFSIFGILLNGYWASRTGERRWHTAAPMLMSGFSLSMAILSGDHLALVIACFCLVGFTFQAYLPVFWSLPSSFLGKSASAAAVGVINSVGNLGGFVGPFVFGYLRTATGSYRAGLWILTGCMFMAGLCASAIRTNGRASLLGNSDSH
jgi:ACS family tartrate transporter-like MFS transporter